MEILDKSSINWLKPLSPLKRQPAIRLSHFTLVPDDYGGWWLPGGKRTTCRETAETEAKRLNSIMAAVVEANQRPTTVVYRTRSQSDFGAFSEGSV